MFMFQGCQYTLFRHHIADKVGLRDLEIGKYDHKTSLHNIFYGDHEPPWHSLLSGPFPSDEELDFLLSRSQVGENIARLTCLPLRQMWFTRHYGRHCYHGLAMQNRSLVFSSGFSMMGQSFNMWTSF
jgi:hypothetical protein